MQHSISQGHVRAAILPAPAPPAALSLTLFLFVALAIASFSEALRIGPDLPIRTVVSVPLILAVFAAALNQGRHVIPSGWGRWIVAAWGVLLFWIFVASMFNGGNPEQVLRKFIGRQFTSFATMCAIVWCARGRSRHQWIMLALASLITISAFVAIMQWLGQGWAWELPYLLNVPLQAGDIDADIIDLAPSATLVSGLYNSAFTCSYFMVVGVALLLPMLLDIRWRFIVVVPLVIVGIGLVVLQERSAAGAAGVCILLFCVWLISTAKGKILSAFLALLILGAGGYFGFTWIMERAEGDGRYALRRYGDFTLGGRDEAAKTALAMGAEHPLFGTPPGRFEAGAGVGSAGTPHNVFLNALVFHGVPGMLISLTIAGLQTWLAWSVWRVGWKRNNYAAVACALAMVGYLLNCQFHNASMLNGDYLGWWVTGFVIAARQNFDEEPVIG